MVVIPGGLKIVVAEKELVDVDVVCVDDSSLVEVEFIHKVALSEDVREESERGIKRSTRLVRHHSILIFRIDNYRREVLSITLCPQRSTVPPGMLSWPLRSSGF